MNKQLAIWSILLIITISLFSILSNNVYSPSSGSTYYEGGTISISWTSSDVGNYIKIELYKSDSYYTTISSNTSNDGYFPWTIPSGYSSSLYYTIRITSLLQSSDYDESSTFYISQKTITVTSPSAGQTIYKGDSCRISWNSEDQNHYFKVELYKNGAFIKTITSSRYSSSNYGYYSWAIPSDLTVGSSYKTKVTDLSNSNIYGFSSSFSIDERSIIITSPAGGEMWYKGEKYTIKWTSKNAGNQVKIEYKKEYDFYYSSIDTYVTNNEEYEWTVSSSLSKNYRYQIKVTSHSYSNIYDISGVFSVDERYIDVKTPSGGEEWCPNEAHLIEWESENVEGQVDIWLLKDDKHILNIAKNVDNNGSYSWSFEKLFSADSDYSIQITSKEYSSVYDKSEKFTIEGQTITIESPRDGDIWHMGAAYDILWESENAGDFVNIQLYNNKEYVMTIASNVENSGEYKWTNVPSDISVGSSYNIRIVSVLNDDVYAFSKGSFTIQENFFEKILGPILIIAAICGIIVVAVVFLKMKGKLFKNKKDKTDKSDFERKPVGSKPELKPEEYDQIWEREQ